MFVAPRPRFAVRSSLATDCEPPILTVRANRSTVSGLD